MEMEEKKKRVIAAELLATGESLKERYTEKEKPELVVERKPVRSVIRIIGFIRTMICAAFAVIGLFALVNLELRQAFVSLVKAFFVETGLF